MESNFYQKKSTFSSFQKASSTELESGKYAGGSRPSCAFNDEVGSLCMTVAIFPQTIGDNFGSYFAGYIK